jgi:hypothetical protein
MRKIVVSFVLVGLPVGCAEPSAEPRLNQAEVQAAYKRCVTSQAKQWIKKRKDRPKPWFNVAVTLARGPCQDRRKAFDEGYGTDGLSLRDVRAAVREWEQEQLSR